MATSLIMETIPSGYEDEDLIELEAVGRSHRSVRFDLTHGDREDLEAQHCHEPKHTNTLQRNSWSSSTQMVLSSMPSRSIRWNQTAVLSQNQSRSAKTRRRRAPNPVSSTSSAANQHVFRGREDCAHDATQKEELLNKLQDLPAGECVRLLREMPLSVSKKREIRALCFGWELEQPLSEDRALCCHQFKACFLKVLSGCWLGRLSLQKSLQLWQKVLKNISARFGTGILSYFIFLRRLLLYNILFFLINGLFLLLPQISNPPQPSEDKPTDFWMLTGTGILTDSVMFYGHYTNSTIGNCQAQTKMCPHNYNIPLAYIFTIGTGMFVTCVMLVYRMSKSFEKSFCTFKTTGNLSLKVFCSWDFKVCRKRSVKLQAVNICTQLKEMLSELGCRKQKRNLCSTLGWLSVHLIVWSVCLLCIGACMLAVYYLPPYIEQGGLLPVQENDPVRLLTLPLVVSCLSHLLPGFFDSLSRGEDYNSPSVRIYVSIVRNLLLKGCIFIVLCHYWLQIDERNKAGKDLLCWETFVGQELYRLVLMDLIVAVLHIIFAEFLWGLCIRNFSLRSRKLEFDIARDVLELIYGQTLVWFGVLFSPLLPAVQIGKLLLLFYFKKTSLMKNFQAPRKHWRATQMSTLFVSLLFLPSFIGALMCVIYTMWRIKPSSHCGPFRSFHNMLLLGKQWFIGLGNSDSSLYWLGRAYIHLVDNPLFLFIFAGLFLTIIYIHMQVLDGQKLNIGRLQKQIDHEGEDKKFLIAKLQALNEAIAQQRGVSITLSPADYLYYP
ncbi:transmembrane channel-like protein 6 isoform X1 [Rhinichthys klamathensis goyatoka]|uniref:transmembrane channel-like protein 6 isoform X1 n=2 Tax=Rhinichthys klamathensis goyatoka TaxID=3034132 RepID=UPI0024B6076D|nr:transmembrane channel-like protein 6 isoform X1 [Rhinichthys klamathensis goyatoka]